MNKGSQFTKQCRIDEITAINIPEQEICRLKFLKMNLYNIVLSDEATVRVFLF